MFSKVLSRSAVSVLGLVFVMSLWIGLPGAIADEEPDPCEGLPSFGCPDDCEFTTYFRLEDCKFKTRGINPYFILKPGYRLVLEGGGEKSVETVLCDTKWINLDGRRIKTRVVEERAYEIEDGEETLVEISRNYFAICKKTNAVYYFGEASRDCPEGFNENDECEGGAATTGSWEAGKNGAKPGLIMPGTPLKGARYFQEIAVNDNAVDRGEIGDVGFTHPVLGDELSGCIEINDTNPTAPPPDGPVCEAGEDVKIYCPGIGLVQDQELVLVEAGFVGCDDDDDNDDDNDDDDDDGKWRKKWGHYHRRF